MKGRIFYSLFPIFFISFLIIIFNFYTTYRKSYTNLIGIIKSKSTVDTYSNIENDESKFIQTKYYFTCDLFRFGTKVIEVKEETYNKYKVGDSVNIIKVSNNKETYYIVREESQ